MAVVAAFAAALPASAFSLDLDSIAAWGRFPKFCIDTYRWGDKFFNSYDSAYVVGSGYKFNAKITNDSWIEQYNFQLPRDIKVDFATEPSTSMGLYLTYMAVSVGYDINISNLFRGVTKARSRYQFGFSCSLLSAEFYIENNDVGTKISRIGQWKDLKMPFDGAESHSWGVDAYYFFNHKRYSQAAAFNFSKIQHRSQGSFYAGLSIYSQNFDFDFSTLPREMIETLPEWWEDHHYRVTSHNYGIRLGYGYNWAFARKWILGVTASPTIGIRRGFVNSHDETTAFALNYRAKLSVVWNSGRWFFGAVGNIDGAMISDRSTIFLNHDISFSAALGYRFNIW